MGTGTGYMRAYRSHSKYTCCLCRASHLFSWFCFSPPRGLQTPLENKGSLKSAALPVFPNVQNAAVSSRGASSDAQPCRCCRKPPACWATTTHLHKPPGRGAGRREGRIAHSTPTPEPALGPTRDLTAHVGAQVSLGSSSEEEGSLGVVGGKTHGNDY